MKLSRCCGSCQTRKARLYVSAALAGSAFALSALGFALPLKPDALLAVDMNRASVVERIVSSWQSELPAMQRGDFKTKLMSLRADQLLAANLSGSFDGVLEVLASHESAKVATAHLLANSVDNGAVGGSNGSEATTTLSADRQKALGELDKDLVYTPIAPCRIVDTRPSQGGTGPISANSSKNFLGSNATDTFAAQGGHASNCAIPNEAEAIVFVGTVVFNSASGYMTVWPTGSAMPLSVLTNYTAPGLLISNTAIVPLGTGRQFSVFSTATTDFGADAVGYFMPPTRTGNGLRVIQTTGYGYTDAPMVINGSASNVASGQGATVGGGGASGIDCIDPISGSPTRNCRNAATSVFATVSGGLSNLAGAFASTVGGGVYNNADAQSSTVGGGERNVAGAIASTVSGGYQNTANFPGSTVGGGFYNFSLGSSSTVGGGDRNYSSGSFSTISGGANNIARSSFAWAGGRAAVAGNQNGNPTHGAFVWADSNANGGSIQYFYSTAQDQFAVRARGGVAFRVVATGDAATGAGCSLPAGGAASWSCSSDRNLKEAVQAISPKAILAKVSTLPLSTWQFKGTDRRHLGPMAQDFKAAFGLGADDKNITTSDVSGVALAAIQGLNQKLTTEGKAKDAKISALEKANEAMQRELAAIKKKLGL